MNAFSLTPSSLLSKNDVCLRNPFLSYIWWFYFCLFFLELFTSEWFSIYKKKSKAALAALLFSCGCAQNLLVKAFSHRLNQIGHRNAQKSP